MLSEDNDFEYYRNCCDILEEENRQLREELVALKEMVSALVARNNNAKPDRKQDRHLHSNFIFDYLQS